VALLWSLYLLKDKLGITLEAAHFNHHLRGEESQRDEDFVRELCDRFDIPLHLGGGTVIPSEKGLEAAARNARYGFFDTLPGKIATAHTADGNAETVLMRMIRGTGLKGLGAIAPVRGRIIRPMLTVTRQEVLALLQEYHLPFVEDSSNDTDAFLRNRLRHHVMPLLKQENPRVAENLSQMAMQLRCDEEVIGSLAGETLPPISALREMPKPVRSRALERFLKQNGIREPERRHILLVEELVYSANPSAKADLPGGVSVSRCYDTLTVLQREEKWQEKEIACPGVTELPELGIRVVCRQAQQILQEENIFTVQTVGKMLLRPKTAGDVITLPGGTKSLKKLFIDKKIPAHRRSQIPVLADDAGLLAVYGIGADQKRMAKALPAWQVTFQKIEK
jgi:tRNA(Ile)-lysidine synthase